MNTNMQGKMQQNTSASGDKKELDKKKKINEFYNIWDSELKLSQEEDDLLYDLNSVITNNFSLKNDKQHSNQNLNNNHNSIIKEINENNENSLTENDHLNKIQETFKKTLSDIEFSKSQLSQINKDIDFSFNKLIVILECRNELSSTLKEFNNSTKTLIQDQEKLQKLCRNVEKMLKHYEIVHSIQAFFDNTGPEAVEKLRFVTDYEEIENGIQFFTINKDYTEAERYLNTHKMLKKIAINRYYDYIIQSIQTIPNFNDPEMLKNSLFVLISKNAPTILDKRIYNFPKNYPKLKQIQQFFEKKTKHDLDVNVTIEKLKVNFLKKRIEIISPYLQEILKTLDVIDENLNNNLLEVLKLTFCELLYFCQIFQTKISESIFNIQAITDEIYGSLYTVIRPIVIGADKLDELFEYFNVFDKNFSFLYHQIQDINAISISDIKNYFQHFVIYDNETLTSLVNEANLPHFIDFFKCSKRLINPTITNIIKDIQEKVYFKTSLQIKKNFIDLESEFNDFTIYEEKITVMYKNYPLFHFFLRKLALLLFLLKNKLDKEVLSEMTISCMEKFINIINNEIVNKKDLTINFQIYIIQQLILALQIIEDYELDVTDKQVDIDFYSITEIFKENVKLLFTQLNIREVIANSIPKIFNQSRDFKKILYNHLIKSYSILVNIINELIFGREIMEVVYKIRKKEDISSEYFETRLLEKKNKFEEIYINFEKIVKEIKEQLFVIDEIIGKKILQMGIENISGILMQLEEEIGKNDERKFEQISNIIESELKNKNLEKLLETN